MTPEEIVTTQCTLYSRMDLFSQILEVQFSNFLRAAHGLDNFRKDLRNLYILNPLISNGVVTENLTTELLRARSIYDVNLYSTYVQVGTVVTPGTKILLPEKYKNADSTDLYDYYDIPTRYVWQIFGQTITLRDVDTATTCIELKVLAYPTYAQNDINGEWQSDSWILLQYPEILSVYCSQYIATKVKDRELLQSAVLEFNRVKTEFLSACAQEIITWR